VVVTTGATSKQKPLSLQAGCLPDAQTNNSVKALKGETLVNSMLLLFQFH